MRLSVAIFTDQLVWNGYRVVPPGWVVSPACLAYHAPASMMVDTLELLASINLVLPSRIAIVASPQNAA